MARGHCLDHRGRTELPWPAETGPPGQGTVTYVLAAGGIGLGMPSSEPAHRFRQARTSAPRATVGVSAVEVLASAAAPCTLFLTVSPSAETDQGAGWVPGWVPSTQDKRRGVHDGGPTEGVQKQGWAHGS